MTQRHGLASDDDGQGIFHFGFSYLVNHFQQSQERMDIELVALAQKHRPTILLLDRAAQYYEECDAILRRDHHLWEMADGRHISEIAPIMKAMEDGPIFLDAILNYLRTHADVHAGLVRKLYGPHGKDMIKGGDALAGRESFTAHRSLFLNKRPDFDPQYMRILETSTWWFDALAGREFSQEAPAVRDLLTHRLGQYSHGFSEGGYHPGITGWKAGVSVDARKLIRVIVHGYYAMLDATYAHFFPRVAEQLSDAMPVRTDFMHVGSEGPWFVAWFYPRVPPPEAPVD